MGEITIILLLALIFLGPKKLPELASGLGKLIREIRKTTSDVKNEIQLDEVIRKPMEELREAMTLHPDELKRRDRMKIELAELQRQAEAAAAAADEIKARIVAEGGEFASMPDDAAGLATGEAPAAEGATPDQTTVDAHGAGIDPAAGAHTPPPVVNVPTAAPAGTIAREPSAAVSAGAGHEGPGHTPPAPRWQPCWRAARRRRGAPAPKRARPLPGRISCARCGPYPMRAPRRPRGPIPPYPRRAPPIAATPPRR